MYHDTLQEDHTTPWATESLPRPTMSMTLAVSQASHLLSRLVTPVPLTQLPQRKPVVERERDRAHLNHNDRAH